MIDTLLAHSTAFDATDRARRSGCPARYGVVTLHRPSNVDDPERRAARSSSALRRASPSVVPLVLPLHPRGRADARGGRRSRDADGSGSSSRSATSTFLSLVAGARLVLTDSGGIQEETTILGIPCLTLRPNTERPITISQARTAWSRRARSSGRRRGSSRPGPADRPRPPLWDGHASERIAGIVEAWRAEREAAPLVEQRA